MLSRLPNVVQMPGRRSILCLEPLRFAYPTLAMSVSIISMNRYGFVNALPLHGVRTDGGGLVVGQNTYHESNQRGLAR